MKTFPFLTFFLFSILSYGQKNSTTNNFDKDRVITIHKSVSIDFKDRDSLFLSAQRGNGLAILQNKPFTKGTIELDIANDNLHDKNIIGVAFNIQNDSTYEAICFRPFNFVAKRQIRKSHLIQYINPPKFTWTKLREEKPGEFNNELILPLTSNTWFHIKILITEKEVQVFVNENTKKPNLIVTRLTTSKSDKIGLWVENNSHGKFKNIRVLN